MLVMVLFLQGPNNSGVLGSSSILQLTADTFCSTHRCWFYAFPVEYEPAGELCICKPFQMPKDFGLMQHPCLSDGSFLGTLHLLNVSLLQALFCASQACSPAVSAPGPVHLQCPLGWGILSATKISKYRSLTFLPLQK